MKKLLLSTFAVFLSLVFVACDFQSQENETKQWKAEHVILIGLDGWGSYSVEKADMPNVKELMNEGAYTLQKRTVLPSSSAVNWASMFMGAGPELHGFTTWGSQTPDLPSRELNENGMFPNIFQLFRDAAPDAEIGALFEWGGIRYVVDTLAVNHIGHFHNSDKTNTALTKAAVEYIVSEKPNLLTVIYDSPDDVGHSEGHDTPGYYEMLKHLDNQVGEILTAIKDAGIYENTIVIVTSDHGGIEDNHGGKTMMEMETPFIIAGKNVKNIGEFSQSMMQFDVAAVIAKIFALEQPEVWIARPVGVVFD